MSKPPMVFDPAQHTGAGRSKRRPPPRPAGDSLPSLECVVAGCGTDKSLFVGEPEGFSVDFTPSSLVGTFSLADEGLHLWFCSLGCLGRWAALTEVRQ